MNLVHNGPGPATLWDHPTVRLNHGEAALFQSLGDPAERTACLVLYSGAEPGQRLALAQGISTLGRAPDCTLPLDGAGLSRRHAELRVAGDEVLLRDLGSVNGTRVNERRVEGHVPLQDGDMLRLGDVVLKFFQRHSIDALLHDRIYRMATVDAGTEVFTKRFVMDALGREVRRARRSGHALSVLCMDLDHFKTVNDRWGHNAGDQVLREAAAAAHATVRAGDILGRTGGEEFLVVLPATPLAEAGALAERVRLAVATVSSTLRLEDGSEVQHQQTASLGAAQFKPTMADARELLGAADARLYEAKRNGRNRVAV